MGWKRGEIYGLPTLTLWTTDNGPFPGLGAVSTRFGTNAPQSPLSQRTAAKFVSHAAARLGSVFARAAAEQLGLNHDSVPTLRAIVHAKPPLVPSAHHAIHVFSKVVFQTILRLALCRLHCDSALTTAERRTREDSACTIFGASSAQMRTRLPRFPLSHHAIHRGTVGIHGGRTRLRRAVARLECASATTVHSAVNASCADLYSSAARMRAKLPFSPLPQEAITGCHCLLLRGEGSLKGIHAALEDTVFITGAPGILWTAIPWTAIAWTAFTWASVRLTRLGFR